MPKFRSLSVSLLFVFNNLVRLLTKICPKKLWMIEPMIIVCVVGSSSMASVCGGTLAMLDAGEKLNACLFALYLR